MAIQIGQSVKHNGSGKKPGALSWDSYQFQHGDHRRYRRFLYPIQIVRGLFVVTRRMF